MAHWAMEKKWDWGSNFGNKLKTSKFKWHEGLFLLTVGTLLAWSMAIAIISGTELYFFPAAALVRAFTVMVALWLIFYNKYTLIFSGVVVVVAMIILAANAIFTVPIEIYEGYYYYPSTIIENIVAPIQGTIRYITGFTSYAPEYDAVIVWTLAIVLGIYVMVFGLLIFNFYVLLGTSVIAFGILLSSGLFSYHFAFYVYAFCIIAYLIRHLNMKSMGKKNENSKFSLYAMPITAVALIPAILLPTPEAGSAARWRDTLITRPFNNINEQITAFLQPRHFSLAQTGFGGGGGRTLGGNVATNHRLFMRINPINQNNSLFYMTGATFDYYTGYSWLNSFREDTYEVDFSGIEQNLEALERMSSPFTMWLTDDNDNFFQAYQQIISDFEADLQNFWVEWEALYDFVLSADFSDTDNYVTINVDELWDFLTETFDEVLEWENLHLLEVETVLYNLSTSFADRWGTSSNHQYGGVSDIVFMELAHRYTNIEHIFRSYNVFIQNIFSGTSGDSTSPVREVGGAVLTSNMMRPGATYTVRHSGIAGDLDEEAVKSASFRGALAEARGAIYYNYVNDGFPHYLLAFDVEDEVVTYLRLLDYLIQRADWIYETYTQMSASTPTRVANLARQITANAQNDFERSNMIADYLRWHGGFTYTLSPGDTPQGRDFVDWFLFDGRAGYCVHFATSFVVMMRSLGIPARYVEGFMVSGGRDEDGYIDVVNRMGHAWGEVYFEGFGWHKFEATPPEAIVGWQVPEDQVSDIPPGWDWMLLDEYTFGGGDEGIYEDWGDIWGGFTGNADGDGGAMSGFDEYYYEYEEYLRPLPQGTDMGIRELLLAAISVAGGIALLALVLRVAIAELQFKRLRRKDGRTATLVYYARILRYLECLNLQADEGDTPLTFARRLGYKKGYENQKMHLEDIAHILYRAKYSSHPIGDKEKELMSNSLFLLDFKLKEQVGFWRYLGYKLTKIPRLGG